MDSAAAMLSGLADDLESERRVYGQLAEEQRQAAVSQGTVPSPAGTPGVVNPDIQRAMEVSEAAGDEVGDLTHITHL